ncbi:T9SS type A sorting domain-containing protein, partial [bacterium]|nr:T9SS type A sorting domain-containing protein [bacterium]
GMVDYCNPPPHTLAGNFSSDDYPDIARFDGSRLEIFISMTYGYTPTPQEVKTFDKPIASLGFGGTVWDTHPPLKVIFSDGSEELFYIHRGMLDLDGDVLHSPSPRPPRTISEADFEIVWESDHYEYGMDECTVGDLDNDGINELITYWRYFNPWDTCWVLIYKNTGNDQYELYMEEAFTNPEYNADITFMCITDIDQNGQNELLLTYDKCFFWEFSEPGIYRPWVSRFIFPRAVKDLKIADMDQDGIIEFVALTSTFGCSPPTAYNVEEYGWKSEADSMIYTNSEWGQYQNWPDARIDVGDFDNDGAVDIVSGNFGYVINYDPVDIQYFRCYPAAYFTMTQHWLETGIPLSCVNPVIADMDNDGVSELYAGGLYPNGGSAFVWEGTGFETGYVAWLDTVSSPNGPNESSFGYIDCQPSIIATHIYPNTIDDSQLLLWSFCNNNYTNLWQSPIAELTAYCNPQIFDGDLDGKQSIFLAAKFTNVLIDWEQTSTGIWALPRDQVPSHFRLNPVYPNPFNPVTTVTFTLPVAGEVDLSVFDITGARVEVACPFGGLVPTRSYPLGTHSVQFDGSNLASGIYFIRLQAGEFTALQKMVLLK